MASSGNAGPSREAEDGGSQAVDPSTEKSQITPELRDVFKCQLTIVLTAVEELKNNAHLDKIDLFARSLENDVYCMANTRYEYYSFMSQTIYKYKLQGEELQQEMEENQEKTFEDVQKIENEESQQQEFEDDLKKENEEAQQKEFEEVVQQPEAQEPQLKVEILRPKNPFLEVKILHPNNPLLDFKMLLLSVAVGIIYQIITML